MIRRAGCRSLDPARSRCDDHRVITVEERGAVSVVRIENGPVDVLGLDTLRELAATLDGLTEHPRSC